MFKYAVLLAVLGCAWAAPKEDAAAAQPIQLSEFIANAEKTLEGLATNIKTQLNIPDQETVVNTLKTQSTTFVDNAKSYINQANEQVVTSAQIHSFAFFFLLHSCAGRALATACSLRYCSSHKALLHITKE